MLSCLLDCSSIDLGVSKQQRSAMSFGLMSDYVIVAGNILQHLPYFQPSDIAKSVSVITNYQKSIKQGLIDLNVGGIDKLLKAICTNMGAVWHPIWQTSASLTTRMAMLKILLAFLDVWKAAHYVLLNVEVSHHNLINISFCA